MQLQTILVKYIKILYLDHDYYLNPLDQYNLFYFLGNSLLNIFLQYLYQLLRLKHVIQPSI
jgi:hypothetical protein